MAVPQTNFDPPFNITRASHLVLTAQDLPASRIFYIEVIGLLVSDEDADTIYLRGVEERGHHSLTLKKTTGEPSCECIGMHVFDEEDLDKAKSHFDRTGVATKFVQVPYQGRTLRFHDVMGTPVELCATMPTQPRSHVAVHTHRGARALRMDHYQVLVPDVMRAASFYTDLGFRISDYLVVDGTDIGSAFSSIGRTIPWDIVFLHRSGPQFHHCGYVVESLYDLIRGLDCAGNVGFGECIEHGPAGTAMDTPITPTSRSRRPPHRVAAAAMQVVDRYDEPVACPIEANSVGNRWGFRRRAAGSRKPRRLPARSWCVRRSRRSADLENIWFQELAAAAGRIAQERVMRG